MVNLLLMGIKKLNKLLYEKNLVKTYLDLDDLLLDVKLNNGVNYIAIDTSIYIYKYVNIANGTLFLTLFKNQIKRFLNKNIIPIYVFDTDVIDNKNFIINKRRKSKYVNYNDSVPTKPKSNNKVSLTSINSTHIQSIKDLFDKLHVPYINSPTESDFICSRLVQNNIAFGCLSDDMDLLILGCKYLIKYNKGCYTLYDYEYIIDKLQITTEQFLNLAIFLGCDYCLPLNPSYDYETILNLIYTKEYTEIIRNHADVDFHSKYYPITYYSTLTEIMNFSLYTDDNENAYNMILENFNVAKSILTISNDKYNIVSDINNYHNNILLIIINLKRYARNN